MKDLRTIQVAEQLVKNLMWLERSNPLLTTEDLLEFGCKFSDRLRAQYEQVRDTWHNELAPMKTLEMAFRYLLICELDTISATKAAPRALQCERSEHKRERAFTRLGRRYVRDLSLPMARGRAEILGGDSTRICTTA